MIPGTMFLGLNDVYIKKMLSTGINEKVLLPLGFLTVGILLSVVAVLVGLPEIKPKFWPAISATILLNFFAQKAWYHAFKKREVSLISPIRLLTPLLVLGSGWLILGESPSFLGGFGVVTTIAGLWLLLTSEQSSNKISFFTMCKQNGVGYAFFGAILWAFSLPFDKEAVINSSSILFSGFISLALGVIFLLCLLILIGSFLGNFLNGGS